MGIIMQMIKLVMIAMLVWGSQAFADVSSGGDSLKSKLVQIRIKALDLNDEFSGLRLRPREDITNVAIAEKTMLKIFRACFPLDAGST